MPQQFINNFTTLLFADLGIGVPTMTLQSGDGASLDAAAGGTLSVTDNILITLQNAAGDIEIVNATGATGDVITIVRAQEGTTDSAWLTNDAVEARLTAATMDAALIDTTGGGGGGTLWTGAYFEEVHNFSPTFTPDAVNGQFQYMNPTAAYGGAIIVDITTPTAASAEGEEMILVVEAGAALTSVTFQNATGTWFAAGGDHHVTTEAPAGVVFNTVATGDVFLARIGSIRGNAVKTCYVIKMPT